jgi:hypothetical protein
MSRVSDYPSIGYTSVMFRCNHCHTEYGGIRGLSADICPRCRDRQAAAASNASAFASSDSTRLTASSWSLPPRPLVGEIARLDRAVRF